MPTLSSEGRYADATARFTISNDSSKIVESSRLFERPISPGAFSDISSDGQDQPSLNIPHKSRALVQQSRLRRCMDAFWVKNKGLVYVTASQVFNCLMNVLITILEVEGNHGKGFHPLQVLFVRMGITATVASLYMFLTKTPDFPLGAKGIRWHLVLRGFGGFFGVSAMYYSLIYLPLADATVITFLSPVIACAVCAYLLKQPFTRLEQIATAISLTGVILIARPTALFSFFQGSSDQQIEVAVGVSTNSTSLEQVTVANHAVTAHEKVIAVGVALVGALGGAIVITTLRWIGSRAHPLITVNYFAAMVTCISAILCATVPSIGYAMPGNSKEWGYLLLLGICGFTAQALGAAGLQYEKSSRATNMIYTQMLFALILDQVIFLHRPELLSMIGSTLILGSAICIAFRNDGSKAQSKKSEARLAMLDEEVGLMEDQAEDEAEEIALNQIPTARREK